MDVLVVTDVTEAGRGLSAPSAEHPVRYKLIYLGETTFGQTWAGEILPKKEDAMRWMRQSLATQGYRPADATHPPEILLTFKWGLLSGGEDRPALGLLGGDRVNLMWENEPSYGDFVNPNVLRRGLIRMGVAAKIWDLTGGDLYIGIVQAHTIDSETAARPTLLWETRFGCPALGLSLAQTMPLLIKSAALSFGRETLKPVNLNATERFGTNVNLGDTEYLGEATDPAEAVVGNPTRPAEDK